MDGLALLAREEKTTQGKIAEHLGYLNRMASAGVISKQLASKARVVWWFAYLSTLRELPVPAATAFDGGPVQYHWSIGDHQMSVEIPAEGSCHWSYRNKVSGEIWGMETPADDDLPLRLVEHLTRIASSNR